MRVCHVTPHLPPDQAANALLPAELGRWMGARGDEVSYVAHEAAQTSNATPQVPHLAGPVSWISRRQRAGGIAGLLRLDALRVAHAVTAALDQAAPRADLLHLHSNGLIIEVAAAWARRHGTPYVLTLYGTEIWHYKRRWPIDPFTRAYQRAAQVTFYSHGLLDRARALGLDRTGLSVVYPPVAEGFVPLDSEARLALRAMLGLRERLVILNVKRLHELAGQRFLIAAFAELAQRRNDVRLVICGTGPLRAELERQSRAAKVDDRVTFTGLVGNDVVAQFAAAADVFALPSILEALPTVAVEALACGTPVVSADHPGGVELHAIFGDDVTVVPREDAGALARALEEILERPRRTREATASRLRDRFSPAAVLSAFDALYRQALTG